eukprot:jgi/Psemu1/66509/estExt_Genemark1.C_2130016
MPREGEEARSVKASGRRFLEIRGLLRGWMPTASSDRSESKNNSPRHGSLDQNTLEGTHLSKQFRTREIELVAIRRDRELSSYSDLFGNANAAVMVRFTLNDENQNQNENQNENDAERYDIRQSFAALDTRKTGRLGIDLAYTLLLGLGYLSDYTKKDEFTVTTLEALARKIEQHEDAEHHDHGADSGKGYIDASDVVRLGDSVGTFGMDNDLSIPIDEANDMIATTNQMFAANPAGGRNSEKHKPNHNHERLDASVWEQMFAPSSM